MATMKRVVAVIALLLGMGAGAWAQSQTPRAFRVTVTGKGAPMILIPGLDSAGAVWDSTVARYSSRYECHVLTLAGFAGQPPISGALLEAARKELAAYIRERRLQRPVIVGHSLGGFLALWLAAREPDLPGRVIVVDSLPALGAAANPMASAQEIEAGAARLRDLMLAASDEKRQQMLKASIETMATSPADVERIVGWGRASDGPATARAMYELLATDLRDEVAKIKVPTMVMGTWVAYQKFATREQILENFKLQYRKLSGVQIEMAPTARHFIMYDQPDWMFSRMDAFLGSGK